VARGRGALDVLDDLKIGLLTGNLEAFTVNRLRDAAASLKTSPAIPTSTSRCPRSSFGSKSNWPRPGNFSFGRLSCGLEG
jgi:hypothetical protein